MNTTASKAYKFDVDYTLRILGVLDALPITQTEPFYSILLQQTTEDKYLGWGTVLGVKKFLLNSIPRIQATPLLKDFQDNVQEYSISDPTQV